MTAPEPLLEAEGLWRAYPRRGPGAPPTGPVVEAVRDVSLEVGRGEALGIVGRSGSGKSTLARLLLALEAPDRGSVHFKGRLISGVSEAEVRPLRRFFQAVFQDPSTSLDPCLKVGTIVAEPLAAHRIGTDDERRRRVRELLERVGLAAESAERFPDGFSGGERQRVAIARALAPEPELLILDEPLSSLDVSVQVRILGLIADLRAQLDLSLVMISHDFAVIRGLCERVLVMHEGAIVDEGPTEEVFRHPRHDVTRQLVEAAAVTDGNV
ncbi:MAG TPA: ATP-binding cassette domain-containing protein [Chondromyces sp.]|nr:ATP-binding cassette domain-containing protein [Chondromyces sp.]